MTMIRVPDIAMRRKKKVSDTIFAEKVSDTIFYTPKTGSISR